MLPSLSKFLLLLVVFYILRMVFKTMTVGPGGSATRPRFTTAAHSAGTIWRDLGRARASSQAPATAQKAAVEMVRCERCGAYTSQGAGCDRSDCTRR